MAGKKRSGLATHRRAYNYTEYTPTTYTVTYDGNANTSGNVPIDASSSYLPGLTVTVLGNSGSPILTKSGFAFAGWNTTGNGSGTSYSQGDTFVINANATLYAQWTPTYTVIYEGNANAGGNVPTDGSSPYIVGSTVTVLGNSGSPVLTRPEFVFAGWNTDEDGFGTSYSQGNTFVINENIVLYAQWTPTYTVTYNDNTNAVGNVPTDGSSPYVVGSTVTVFGNSGSPALARSGFAFSGWNTLEDGSGTSYSQGNTFAINENIVLYAQWTQVDTYTVTYDGNANTSGIVPTDGSSPYNSGSTVTVFGNSGSPALANSGLVFAGWNTSEDGSGTSYSQGNTFTITDNIVLYARWVTVLPPAPPVLDASGVGGNQAAYILFTQSGTVTNYEYSTDNGANFLPFNPPQIHSPVEINVLSSDGVTRLEIGTTYTVKLKAVNSGVSSVESNSATVVPVVTSLVDNATRIIYLDANNPSSYSGSGNAWTNLESGGALSATLNGSPTFNTTDPDNKYFEFNPGSLTGQFAQIGQAGAINPDVNDPFTIQMWVKINNVGSQGSLVSKVFYSSSYDGYALGYRTDNTLELHENGSQVRYFPSVAGVLSSGWALYTANIQFGNGGGRTNKIFVNGRQVLSVTSTDNISSPTQDLTFPTGFYGEGECDIGQFYYYNTELTVTQVIQNYDASKPKYIY